MSQRRPRSVWGRPNGSASCTSERALEAEDDRRGCAAVVERASLQRDVEDAELVDAEVAGIAVVAAYPDVVAEVTHHTASERVGQIIISDVGQRPEIDTALHEADAGQSERTDAGALLAPER